MRSACGQSASAALSLFRQEGTPRARVMVVQKDDATDAFQARPETVTAMVHSGLIYFTGKPTVASAWLSLVTTQDTIGIKVFSAPGPNSGTRPAVVAAVVEGLLEAKIPPQHITVWDKHRADLRRAGFFEFESRYGIHVQGSAATGYDEKTFYSPERPLLGQLVWGDQEFGRKGEEVGRRSFVSKLVSQEMTKIINITPLLNHNSVGVAGNLYSLAMGSVDNTIRFETDPARLAEAVPEIYALPVLGDRVVLNIVDALICQYQGEQRSLLHYSKALNELRFSKDAVALDVLSLHELDRQRRMNGISLVSTNSLELYHNAALLELGVSKLEHIEVERAP
jgi:hypothetical protein